MPQLIASTEFYRVDDHIPVSMVIHIAAREWQRQLGCKPPQLRKVLECLAATAHKRDNTSPQKKITGNILGLSLSTYTSPPFILVRLDSLLGV